MIIHSVQRESFNKETETLSKGGNISGKVPLSKLNPFLDEDGLLRVGGRLKRLEHQTIYSQRRPFVLLDYGLLDARNA